VGILSNRAVATAKDLELLTTIVYLNKESILDENKMTRAEAGILGRCSENA
jgi:hypothetical protein